MQADKETAAAKEARRFIVEGCLREKAVLYCSTIAQGMRLVRDLDCILYYSKASSKAEKN